MRSKEGSTTHHSSPAEPNDTEKCNSEYLKSFTNEQNSYWQKEVLRRGESAATKNCEL